MPKAGDRVFPVKMDVAVGKRDSEGRQRVVVTLMIAKGYFAFANPTDHEDFDVEKTILRVAGKGITKDVAITYPKGTVVKDDIIGDYKVYRGAVKLEAVVQRRDDQTGPLEVSIRVRPVGSVPCLWRTTTLRKSVPRSES